MFQTVTASIRLTCLIGSAFLSANKPKFVIFENQRVEAGLQRLLKVTRVCFPKVTRWLACSSIRRRLLHVIDDEEIPNSLGGFEL
jgi:hypothetical protein